MAKQWKIDDFETVFQQYKDIVFKTAYLMLGNAHEAEDVMQEVFVKVYKSWNTYDPEKGALYTWIRKITVNESISQRRRKRPPSVSLEKLQEEQGFDPKDIDLEPHDERLIRSERSERMWEAMRSLDEKHRAVLVLRYHDCLSYDEMAEVLGIPLGTVKSRLNAAVGALREEMMRTGVAL